MENIFKLFDGWPLKTQKMAQKAENRYFGNLEIRVWFSIFPKEF